MLLQIFVKESFVNFRANYKWKPNWRQLIFPFSILLHFYYCYFKQKLIRINSLLNYLIIIFERKLCYQMSRKQAIGILFCLEILHFPFTNRATCLTIRSGSDVWYVTSGCWNWFQKKIRCYMLALIMELPEGDNFFGS